MGKILRKWRFRKTCPSSRKYSARLFVTLRLKRQAMPIKLPIQDHPRRHNLPQPFRHMRKNRLMPPMPIPGIQMPIPLVSAKPIQLRLKKIRIPHQRLPIWHRKHWCELSVFRHGFHCRIQWPFRQTDLRVLPPGGLCHISGSHLTF